ncbi:hypothetical protein POTOM_045967 [Populus tomentosa]|uniref:Bis(5'-adenosyl)-triphosphatase n=1 Tax=Populus tomentosa TaxID=118781 RepID=A0A8X8CDQ1_POPTO|nr:hypothetical protein POTOM_045967 [Populus tomentosa]
MVNEAHSISIDNCRLLLRPQRCYSSKGFRPISTTKMSTSMTTEYYQFGPHKIDPKQVFYSTNLSYATVNLRPVHLGLYFYIHLRASHLYNDIVRKHGIADNISRAAVISCKCSILLPLHFVHVLVCPRREVKRFIDLSADETSDLWLTAKKVGRQLESFYIATSLTFTIQDGPRAGQSVPHVHVHIIPRKEGDFEKNDEIYDAIDEREKELKRKLDLDEERRDRSMEEMAQEADGYRLLFS